MASCQAKSRPRAVGTRAAVPFVGWLASSETIVANLRRRRVAAVASFRCVGSSSSNPSLYWRPHDTVEQRQRIRSYRQRSRRLRRGSVASQERSGNCECQDLRGARPSAPGCSSDSFPNRCLPNAARAFPKAFEAHRSGSAPRSLSRRGALSARATAQAGATALCF